MKASWLSVVSVALTYALLSCASPSKMGPHEMTHPPDSCPTCRLYETVKRAVVRIETSKGAGTGSILDARGIVVTNRHVVGDDKEVTVTLFDGRKFNGRVESRGDQVDLAIVRIEGVGEDLPTIPFGSTAEVEEGEEIYVIGHPMNLGWSITRGIISRIRGKEDPQMPNTIQIDAPLSPGNSGGPLLNKRGRLIGVVTFKIIARGAENLGFACPSEKVSEFVRKEKR